MACVAATAIYALRLNTTAGVENRRDLYRLNQRLDTQYRNWREEEIILLLYGKISLAFFDFVFVAFLLLLAVIELE